MTRTEAEIRRRLGEHRAKLEECLSPDFVADDEGRTNLIRLYRSAIRTLEWVLRERE